MRVLPILPRQSSAILRFGSVFGGYGPAAEHVDIENPDEIRQFILDHGQLIEFTGGVIVSEF